MKRFHCCTVENLRISWDSISVNIFTEIGDLAIVVK